MYWGNHVRILFTVTLVWQAAHLEKGREKAHEEDVKSLNATAQKQQPKNEGTIINALSDMNQSYESRKQENSRALVPFTGITESGKLLWMVIFCGGIRYISDLSLVLDSNCGSIAHGTWVLKGCWLCRCGYGTLNCLSEVMHDNCELKSEKEAITRLYSNGIRLQQTVFVLACLFTILVELYCWQL
uniref:Cryptic/Cripto CFC domain-containing protein n=1 Tax=Bubo bubo TaxID=30461 RepID=A0A8C0F4X7_BUBBB